MWRRPTETRYCSEQRSGAHGHQEEAAERKIESIEIKTVKPFDPLIVNAGSFFTGWTFDQLVRMQAIEPLKDAKALAGGWPDDEDLYEVLDEIYEQRH